MKVIICGGRDYVEQPKDMAALDYISQLVGGITEVFCGLATGADDLGKRWAESRGIAVRKFPAKWNEYGKPAGPIRNAEMVVAGPDLNIAFPGNRGTFGCTTMCKNVGIQVLYPYGVDSVKP